MPATAPLRHLKECRRRKCNTGEIPHATLRNSICIFEEKVLAKNKAFKRIINHPSLRNLPFYLETPNDLDGYAREIQMMRDAYIE